jgi:hypothetical protein
MRCLNETIAQRANEEDQCTGHFWEGRFKSQALLNEQALLSCMTYVDLNPIRAGLAQNLDGSKFTSIEQRIKEIQLVKTPDSSLPTKNSSMPRDKKKDDHLESIKLSEFVGGYDIEGIPFTLMDYLELADWTGRILREDKTGYIPESEPKIMAKFGFSHKTWLKSIAQYGDHFYSHIGSGEQLKAVSKQFEKKWIVGIRHCQQLF